MANMDTSSQDWPDQRLKILIPTWILMVISTIFVAWRVVYGFKKTRVFMTSDYLLIIATVRTKLSRKTNLGLTVPTTASQRRRDMRNISGRRLWTGATFQRSHCFAANPAVLLLPLDIANHQHHRSRIPQVGYLCLSPGAQLFQSIPNHCVAVNLDGDCVQFSGTCFNALWLFTSRSQLELCIPTKKVLGPRKSLVVIHSRHLEHRNRCSLCVIPPVGFYMVTH
jgi:hypothetical protein